MANLNKCFLMGNLTRDPEVSYTPKGTAVAKFGMAINRAWTTEAGEKKEEVTFIDCEAWGRTAETLGQYLKKGRPIFIEARLKLDQWDDKESGQKRSKLKVVVDSFQFIGAPMGGGEKADQPHIANEKEARQVPLTKKETDKPTAQPKSTVSDDADNIPF
jgi:single-strand DNA-binding protein